MIIPSMTCKEIYDHISKETEKIKFWADKLRPKAIKEFRKSAKFPAWKRYNYNSPNTKNDFVIFFYCPNKESKENPTCMYFLTLFDNDQRIIIRCEKGDYKHTPDTPLIDIPQVYIYTKHFLSRYNERCLKDPTLKPIDIACRFLSLNYCFVPVKINEDINRNIEQYGEGAKRGFVVAEGLCFADMRLEGVFNSDGNKENDRCDAFRITLKTFVPLSQLSEHQKIALTKEYMETWNKLVKA